MIQLPSNYEGGQLIVYHQSKSKEFDFSGPVGCGDVHYAAFYADCQHEIKPVTKGYRLCLIYNLVYRGCGNCPAPADNKQIVATVISSMKEWGEDLDEDNPPMMTYLLEHKYCESSLSFELLKSSDQAIADVLTEAKKEIEFDLYIATVSLVENWSVNGFFDSDCSYPSDYSDYEEDQLMDTCITAENLTSCGGQKISNIDLESEYLVPEDFFDDIDPDKKELEVTGNEGANVDRQYHWAALLLWPSKYRTRNLGIVNVVQSLKKDLSISPDKKGELEVVARELLHMCACASPLAKCDMSAQSYVSFLQTLLSFDKVELISEFLDITASFHGDMLEYSSFCNEIPTIGLKYGWDILRSPLLAIFNKMPTSNYLIDKYYQFLFSISQEPVSKGQKEVCHDLAGVAVKVLSDKRDLYMTPSTCVQLLHCLQSLGEMEHILKFMSVMASCSNRMCSSLIESPSFSSEVLAVGSKFGWDILREPLQAIFKKISPDNNAIQFLQTISQQLTSKVHKDICCGLASSIVKALSDEPDTPNLRIMTSSDIRREYRDSKFLLTLTKCLMSLNCEEELLSTLAHAVITKPERYSVVDTLVPVCESLYKSSKKGKGKSKLFELLLSHCISYLEVSSSHVVPCPANWSELATFSCSCKDCVSLMRFIADPTETAHRFKMGKKRRDHLQSQLCDNNCSVATSTDNSGNPHALVVTKTRQAFQNDCQEAEREKNILSHLQALHASRFSCDEPAAKRKKGHNR